MTEPIQELKREIKKWSPWWVLMWIVIAVALLTLVWFLPFGLWTTAVVVFFGVPELIGARVQDDAFPPLTHVIVRYLDREISFPLIFFFYGSTGAYWFMFPNPWRMGLFTGLLGWLIAHFERRYEGRS